MVKTMMRPEGLRLLLASIRRFYPDIPVRVVDDSPTPYPEISAAFPGVIHETFPEDLGIGACLNHILDTDGAQEVILLEDDFQFSEETNLQRLLTPVRMGLFDIVGGGCRNMANHGKLQYFVGRLKFRERNGGQAIEIDHFNVKRLTRLTACDITLNFFAANRQKLQALRWDEELKVARHVDFFLRARTMGYLTGYEPRVILEHHTYQDTWQYQEKRNNRLPEYQQMFLDKHGLVPAEVPAT